MSTIIYPSYYRIFECKSGKWFIKNIEPFCSFSDQRVNHNNIASLHGINEQQVAIELFRINAGKTGYYLANLKQKKYYIYCGLTLDDIKTTLQSLGIGRSDSFES